MTEWKKANGSQPVKPVERIRRLKEKLRQEEGDHGL